MALSIQLLRLAEGMADGSLRVWNDRPGTLLPSPTTAFLILGAAQPIVVDAGVTPEVAAAVDGLTVGPEHSLDRQLGRHGLEPGDVGTVLFTHLHLDHTGLVDQFTNARFVVQQTELRYAAAPLPPTWMYAVSDIIKLIDPLRERVELIDGDTQIAPGIRTVVTGGHSPGHQMVYVDVPSGQAVITGDEVYALDPGLTEGIQPGYVYSSACTHAALRRIKRDAVHPLPSHEPAIYDLYPDGVF